MWGCADLCCHFQLSGNLCSLFRKIITSKVLDISWESLIPNVTYLEAGSMEILLLISFRGRNRKQKLANSSLAKADRWRSTGDQRAHPNPALFASSPKADASSVTHNHLKASNLLGIVLSAKVPIRHIPFYAVWRRPLTSDPFSVFLLPCVTVASRKQLPTYCISAAWHTPLLEFRVYELPLTSMRPSNLKWLSLWQLICGLTLTSEAGTVDNNTADKLGAWSRKWGLFSRAGLEWKP
jgi:hypothetical protein